MVSMVGCRLGFYLARGSTGYGSSVFIAYQFELFGCLQGFSPEDFLVLVVENHFGRLDDLVGLLADSSPPFISLGFCFVLFAFVQIEFMFRCYNQCLLSEII